jgi:hypothetical protein
MEVTSAGRQASMTLLAAQRLAVLRQHAIVVAVDEAHNRLRVHEDGNSNGVIDTGENVKYLQLEDAAAFGRGAAPALPLGNDAVSFVKTQNGMPAITFHRSGSAGETGVLYITSRRALAGRDHAKDSRALDISRSTGRASYFTYDGTAWRRGF